MWPLYFLPVAVAAGAGAGYGVYRLAFWQSPVDRWSANRAANRLPHLTGHPGYELSSYDNMLRAFRAEHANRSNQV